MQHNISPEERLLRLIRKNVKRPAATQEKPAADPKSFSLKKNAAKLTLAAFSFSFKEARRYLSIILLLLGIYLLFESLFINSRRSEEEVLGLEVDKMPQIQGVFPPDIAEETAQAASYYIQPARARNLFTAKTELSRQLPSPTFKEEVSKLRLQGIITEPYPQAIIEDTSSNKTYFLSPGDMLGEIEIKEILPGKVRLNYHGQEAELVL